MFCPNCGNQLPEILRGAYCTKCGQLINGNETTISTIVENTADLPNTSISENETRSEQIEITNADFCSFAESTVKYYEEMLNQQKNPPKPLEKIREEDKTDRQFSIAGKTFIACSILGLFIFELSIGNLIKVVFLNAVIAIVVGTVADHFMTNETKGVKLERERRHNIQQHKNQLITYSEQNLKNIEEQIESRVLEQYGLSAIITIPWFFPALQADSMLDGTVNPRTVLIYRELHDKNIPYTIEEYKKATTLACENWARLIRLNRIQFEAQYILSRIENQIKAYKSNQFSKDFLDKLNLYRATLDIITNEYTSVYTDTAQLPDVYLEEATFLEYVDLPQQLIELQKTIKAEEQMIKNNTSFISEQYKDIRTAFFAIKDKVHNYLYFSQSFQELFQDIQSFCFSDITALNQTSAEQKDLIQSIRNKMQMLNKLFDEEHIAANELFLEQKNAAEELTRKLDNLLAENNDVIYSDSILAMIQRIRKSISVYNNGPKALKTENVNNDLEKLKKMREKERKVILNTIQDYEKRIKELRKLTAIYERPNAGNIALDYTLRF